MRNLSLLLFMMILSVAVAAQERVAFRVSFTEPQAHYADVEMELSGLRSASVDLKMPVWTPGSYLIREFAKNVEGLRGVAADGTVLSSSKIDKNTWRVNIAGKTSIKVNYRIYAFEVSVRTSFVDADHAFLSPTGVFLYPAGKINLPSTITVVPHPSWKKISTGLRAVAGRENTFEASDFDILYDSPIEVGNHDTFEFSAAGVNHEVAMYGGGNYDREVLKRDMAKIVDEQTRMFGVNPNKRYVFIVHNFLSGGGGLEHLNSTVLGASRNSYASPAGLIRFLTLVSHEYFHLWNVKRLRPIALGPFNYDAENYTTSLWIAEGFTAYYESVFVHRTGLIDTDSYLDKLGDAISVVENQPGNKIQPLSESSLDAWIKYYRPNENSPNSTVSYYNKGAMIAMILDLAIIKSTGGKAGLDEVLKAMYEEYYVKKKRGYTDAEFRAMLEKVAGRPFADVYDNYIYGLATIDYDQYLGYAGLALNDEAAGSQKPYIGASLGVAGDRIMVAQVRRGSAAWNAGLNVNDQILGINNYQVSTGNNAGSELMSYIDTRKIGELIEVKVRRDGLEKTISYQVEANPGKMYKIVPVENASAEQLMIRQRWLKQ